jgi:hypothetical protein
MASNDEIKKLAVDIAVKSSGFKPGEFLVAVSMSAASIIRKTIPKDKWKESVEGLTKSIQTILDGSS